MDDNVVDIDDFRPHTTETVKCADCGHTWQAVFPKDTQWLQCPTCGGAAPKGGGHA